MFLLDENDIADRLMDIDEVTRGTFRWSETAGLKQVLREGALDLNAALDFIDLDYGVSAKREAA